MQFDLRKLVAMRNSGLGKALGQRSQVYVISCPGFVKIGVTFDAPVRLRELQVGNPHPLQLVRVYEFRHRAAAHFAERAAHAFLAANAACGEWFAVSDPQDVFEVMDGIHRHADHLIQLRWRRAEAYEADEDARCASEPEFAAHQDGLSRRRDAIRATKAKNRAWRANRAA